MLSPLHFWLTYLGIGVLFVFLAYWGGRWRRLNPKEVAQGDGPAGCAHCGYDVRGLPSDICPECGSDLNEVGRLAPRYRKWQKVPPVLRAVVYTASVLLVGAALVATGSGWMNTFRGMGTQVPMVEQEIWGEYLLHPTLSDADGRPLHVTADSTRRLHRPPGGMDDERMLTEDKIMLQVYFGVTRRPAPEVEGLRLEINRLSNTWHLLDRRTGSLLEGGEGVPEPARVHGWLNDLAADRAPDFGKPLHVRTDTYARTVPVAAPGVDTWTIDNIVSLGQMAGVLQSIPTGEGEEVQEAREAFFNAWSTRRSPDWKRTSSVGMGEHVTVIGWVVLVAPWVVVLGLGLWFVTLRREIRPTSDPGLRSAQPTASGGGPVGMIPSYAGET